MQIKNTLLTIFCLYLLNLQTEKGKIDFLKTIQNRTSTLVDFFVIFFFPTEKGEKTIIVLYETIQKKLFSKNIDPDHPP